MLTSFIKIPYTTNPGMAINTGSIFSSTPDKGIIELKKQELSKLQEDLYGQINEYRLVIEKSANLCNVFSDNILDLALRLEEDVSIMHQGKLIAICFCFPSGFVPVSKLGLSLSDIHQPVADNKHLVKSSQGLARIMTRQKTFIRHVWTVTTNPNLSNHPIYHQIKPINSIEDLWFRWEKQTTLQVDNDTSLFFVKVNVVPLSTVWDNKILSSINSMSQAVLDYKNLNSIKLFLNSVFGKSI